MKKVIGLKKIFINVYDWGVANKIYATKKEADIDAKNRDRYFCIETTITLDQWKKYLFNKRGIEQ